MRRLVRSSLATGGDPLTRAFRRRVETPRKLVLILDVSGSMESYARAMLLYLHAARGSGRGVETFAFGTRLTRLTPELGSRHVESALAAAAERVVDWSGGTRIGESLKAYNDELGKACAHPRRVPPYRVRTAGSAEDPALLDGEMERLARQAFAVVWVNPLQWRPVVSAACQGMRAALRRTSTASCPATTSPASRRSPGCSPASSGGTALASLTPRHVRVPCFVICSLPSIRPSREREEGAAWPSSRIRTKLHELVSETWRSSRSQPASRSPKGRSGCPTARPFQRHAG